MSLTEADVRNKGQQTGNVRFKSGSWYVRFREWRFSEGTWKWADTEKKIDDRGEKLNQKRAELLGYEQWVSKANELNKSPMGHMSLEFFAKNHFKVIVNGYRKSWRKATESMLNRHIIPAFGRLELHEIRRSMVQQWITSKTDSLSGQTVKHLAKILKALFKHATRMEFMTSANPTDDLILPNVESKERPAWTMEQIRQLAAKVREEGYAEYSRIILLVSLTGLRIGECMGLRWCSVDFEEKKIVVREGWTAGERGKTKTKSSVRTIPLTDEAVEILTTQLRMTKWNGMEQPVFAGRTGKPLVASNLLRRVVKPAAVELGMVDFDWHSERHTTATLIDRHVTASEKQKILGHTNEEMGMRYTHPEMERMREALQKATGVVN